MYNFQTSSLIKELEKLITIYPGQSNKRQKENKRKYNEEKRSNKMAVQGPHSMLQDSPH